MTASESIADAKQLLALTELDGILYHEVGATRRAESRETEVNIDISLRRDERKIEVRCAAEVVGEDADFRTDASAVFSLDGPVEITDAALAEFVERVGVMTVYPYLRESIHQLAAKLEVRRPVMKLLRPGDIKVSVRGDGEPSQN